MKTDMAPCSRKVNCDNGMRPDRCMIDRVCVSLFVLVSKSKSTYTALGNHAIQRKTG